MEKPKYSKEVQDLIAALNKSIFVREGKEAAKLYEQIIQREPGFLLRPPAQFDLARLLETSGASELALVAYANLIEKHKDSNLSIPSKKGAGMIAWKLSKFNECVDYLEDFLATKPLTPDRQEAEEILSRLPPAAQERRKRRAMGGDGLHVENANLDEIPSSWAQRDGGKPLTFEWKIPSSSSDRRMGASSNKKPSSDVMGKLPTEPDLPRQAVPKTEDVINLGDMGDGSGFAGLSVPDSAPALPPIQPRGIQSGAPQRSISGPTPALPTPAKPPAPPSPAVQQAPPPVPPGYPMDPNMYPQQPPPGYPPMPGYYPPPGYGPPPPGYPNPPVYPQGYGAPPPGYPQGWPMPPMGYPYPPPGMQQPPQSAPPAVQSKSSIELPDLLPPTERIGSPSGDFIPKPALAPEQVTPANSPGAAPSGGFPAVLTGFTRRGGPPGESSEARFNRLRDGEFALLMPMGKKIHLEEVASIVSRREDIDETTAKKRVLARKGIIYSDLSLNQVMEIHPLMKQSRQSLVFVSVSRDLKPYERYNVAKAEIRDQGLKLATEGAVRRIRWTDIRILNCGTVGTDITVVLTGSDPIKEYWLRASSFDLSGTIPEAGPDLRVGIIELLRLLKERCPSAVRSHTVDQLLAGKQSFPQVFPTEEEFLLYSTWLLLGHFAEIVNVDELMELNQATSNW